MCTPQAKPSPLTFQKPQPFHLIPSLSVQWGVPKNIEILLLRKKEKVDFREATSSPCFSFSPQSVLGREIENTKREIGK